MARTTRRSIARRSKAALPKAKAASWSTDDVYKLLDAVNRVTLRRIEDQATRIEELLKSVNQVTLAASKGNSTPRPIGRRRERMVLRASNGCV